MKMYAELIEKKNYKSIEIKSSMDNKLRYQVLPFDSTVIDYPFVWLPNTYEVNVKRRSTSANGETIVSDCWLRLFDSNSQAYVMKDLSGRVVSSLTTADVDLIAQARGLFDELWEELDARNSRDEHITTLIRKRNYTIFNGYCLNYWANDSRTPTKSNFSSLFVITAKPFLQTVQSNIEEKSQMEGGDVSWISNIYNRNLTGRDGFLVFSINADPNRAGYVISANHEFGRAKQLESVVIPEEDAELMADPMASFLGWQAPKADEGVSPMNRRLFNPAVYKEACAFLSEILAGIRTAKALGTDIKDAIDSTVTKTLAAQPSRGPQTNDPVLAAQQSQGDFNPNVGADAQRIVENTTADTVFTSPSSATLDPITGQPVDNKPAGNPFSNPAPQGAPASGSTPFGGGSPFGGGGFGAGFGK